MIQIEKYVSALPSAPCGECGREWDDPIAYNACCTNQGYVGPDRCCFCDCAECSQADLRADLNRQYLDYVAWAREVGASETMSFNGWYEQRDYDEDEPTLAGWAR